MSIRFFLPGGNLRAVLKLHAVDIKCYQRSERVAFAEREKNLDRAAVAPGKRGRGGFDANSITRIAATVIGEVTDKRKGIKISTADGVVDLPLYERDELTKI